MGYGIPRGQLHGLRSSCGTSGAAPGVGIWGEWMLKSPRGSDPAVEPPEQPQVLRFVVGGIWNPPRAAPWAQIQLWNLWSSSSCWELTCPARGGRWGGSGVKAQGRAVPCAPWGLWVTIPPSVPPPGPQGPGPLLAPDPAQPGPRRSSLRKPPVASSSSSSSSLKRHGCPQALDESQVSLSFQEWLGSVTERIHQTMHYQFEGHPEPLVFHIPQSFFEALQQRISSGSGKKRLPNSTTGDEKGENREKPWGPPAPPLSPLCPSRPPRAAGFPHPPVLLRGSAAAHLQRQRQEEAAQLHHGLRAQGRAAPGHLLQVHLAHHQRPAGEADLRHARGAAGDHPELRAEPRRLLRALPQPPRGGGEPGRGPRETAPAAAPGAADLPQSRRSPRPSPSSGSPTSCPAPAWATGENTLGNRGKYPGKQGKYPGKTGKYPGKRENPGKQGKYPGKTGGNLRKWKYPDKTGKYLRKKGKTSGKRENLRKQGKTSGKQGKNPGKQGKTSGKQGKTSGKQGKTSGKQGKTSGNRRKAQGNREKPKPWENRENRQENTEKPWEKREKTQENPRSEERGGGGGGGGG
uniref:Uncharacterized protein n=1 Tax=Ficedula albicollis TaxID=59894 RepID=A0A803WF15_FICAL